MFSLTLYMDDRSDKPRLPRTPSVRPVPVQDKVS
jgi:hypothetical protein